MGGSAPNYYRTISSIGHILPFIGLFLVLQAAYHVWGAKAKPFSAVKNKISIALIFEAAYYITFIPGTLNIMDFSEFLPGNNFFASIYFLQILRAHNYAVSGNLGSQSKK